MGPVGVPELLLILVLALLIFGPKKLPEIGRAVGKGLGEFRRASNELKRSLDAELALEEESARPKRPEPVRPTPAATIAATAPGAAEAGTAVDQTAFMAADLQPADPSALVITDPSLLHPAAWSELAPQPEPLVPAAGPRSEAATEPAEPTLPALQTPQPPQAPQVAEAVVVGASAQPIEPK